MFRTNYVLVFAFLNWSASPRVPYKDRRCLKYRNGCRFVDKNRRAERRESSHSFSAALIGGGVGPQNRQLSFSNHIAGNFDWFSNHIEHLLVYRVPVLRNQEKADRRSSLRAHEQYRWYAPANAAHGTSPMRCQPTRIHYAQ